MNNPPKTIEEARKYWDWIGRFVLNGEYRYELCAYPLPYTGWMELKYRQCSRRNGHWINGLYCKQHARIVEKGEQKG